MAWTSPFTAAANSVLTAADWNLHVRDNLNETAPAKATIAGRIFVTVGPNAIAEREIAEDSRFPVDSTTSTTYGDLAGSSGPDVTLTTGRFALVIIGARMSNTAAAGRCLASDAVTGATSKAAEDPRSLMAESGAANQGHAMSYAALHTDLTSGSNTFTLKYKVTSGTGNFADRTIIVVAL